MLFHPNLMIVLIIIMKYKSGLFKLCHIHEILINKPYCVLTNCLNCGLCACFEWKDSESVWCHLKKKSNVNNILPGYPHYIGYRQ